MAVDAASRAGDRHGASLSLGVARIDRDFSGLAELLARASETFQLLDLCPGWGPPLRDLRQWKKPVQVRVAPQRYPAPPGESARFDELYPTAAVISAVERVAAAGFTVENVVLHKWASNVCRLYDGTRALGNLRELCNSRFGAGLGIACLDSHPADGLAVARAVDWCSVQFNLSNQRARGVGASYRSAGCQVEVRAPLDAGFLLRRVVQTLPRSDPRHAHFARFQAFALRAADELAQVAQAEQLDPAVLAVAWVLAHDWVDRVCIGASDPAQLRDAETALLVASRIGHRLVSTEQLRRVDWSWRYGVGNIRSPKTDEL